MEKLNMAHSVNLTYWRCFIVQLPQENQASKEKVLTAYLQSFAQGEGGRQEPCRKPVGSNYKA